MTLYYIKKCTMLVAICQVDVRGHTCEQACASNDCNDMIKTTFVNNLSKNNWNERFYQSKKKESTAKNECWLNWWRTFCTELLPFRLFNWNCTHIWN